MVLADAFNVWTFATSVVFFFGLVLLVWTGTSIRGDVRGLKVELSKQSDTLEEVHEHAAEAAVNAKQANDAVNHSGDDDRIFDQVAETRETVKGMAEHQRRFDVQLAAMQAIGEANGLRVEQTRRDVAHLSEEFTKHLNENHE